MAGIIVAAVISMVFLAVFFAGMLAFAHKKLKVEEDPGVKVIFDLLPHINCGACGYLSCQDLAENIVKNEEDPLKCRVLGDKEKEQIFRHLGKENAETVPFYPVVRCSAVRAKKQPAADYKGIRTCRAAGLLFSGGMECQYGCLGFGDCVHSCPFGALEMADGLPQLDKNKCTGCGKCAKTCPRKIIDIVEKRSEKLYYVACSTHDGAVRVRAICGVGCIGCGICEKMSPEGLFKINDSLSREDISKQEQYEKASGLSSKCPTKVIKEL